MQMDGNGRLILPKNIRQMGTFGDTYKVYVEDFVYTYVHQFLHQRWKDETVLAAVLLGKTVSQDGQEYIFINGAQKVDFRVEEILNNGKAQPELQSEQKDGNHPAEQVSKMDLRQQEFWNRVYQRIKESFDDCEILGWYFNLDGSGLKIDARLQNFFETTVQKGSRFLYYEDSVEKEDAFFVQEQHRLQRLSGYAVYYEKNPQMQEFMIAERERLTPKPLRDSYRKTERDEVVENYRAIMNKLNEKPARKKLQPVVYVAGAAVLAVVVAMGVGQIGNYQNLKVLEQTMQTISKAVSGSEKDLSAESEEDTDAQEESKTESVANDTNSLESGEADDVSGNEAYKTKTDALSSETSSETAGMDTQTADDAQTVAQETQTASAAQTDTATEEQSADSTDVLDGEAATASTPSNYYIVQKGDSLALISRKLYGTTDRIQDLCNLNSIENKDIIYEGQKLLLP